MINSEHGLGAYAPKYIKVKQYLLDYLDKKNVQPDEKILSENELMKLLKVSRITVRQAIDMLVNEDILYKIQGKGTFYKGARTKKKNKLIGVISPVVSRYIYIDIMQGIEECAKSNDYGITIATSNASHENEVELIESMLDRGVDGLLIEPALSSEITPSSKIYQILSTLSIPVVLIDCTIEGLSLPCVIIDDFQAGYDATEYLIKQGHSKIAIVYHNEVLSGMHRLQGYEQALKDYKKEIKDDYIYGFAEGVSFEKKDSGYAETQHILSLHEPPTAIFYYNDETALFGIKAIEESKLQIPDDISVLGFDDSIYAVYSKTPLSTFKHPKEKLGVRAADLLIQQIEEPGKLLDTKVVFRPEVIERESVKKI